LGIHEGQVGRWQFFKVVQDGDGEGVATFDPADPNQVKLAVRAAAVKRRGMLSPEHRERCVASLRPRLGGHPAAQERRSRENDPIACKNDPCNAREAQLPRRREAAGESFTIRNADQESVEPES
jgi:hypothetical protein